MKHVVVTGAAGFLGSHLVKSLIHQGHQVTGIDNLSTGVASNLQEVAHSPLFFFREADVTLSDSLDFLIDQPVDEVYHLASPASPKFYQADSIGTIWVNTRGTYHCSNWPVLKEQSSCIRVRVKLMEIPKFIHSLKVIEGM